MVLVTDLILLFSFQGTKNPVTIARRSHLFPSRTQKLSSLAPMILGGKLPGKVGRCRFIWLHGQAVKTPPFHGGNSGSIPDGVTRNEAHCLDSELFFIFLNS